MTPAFWRGRRVFVTGHTGFKGSWLATRLLDLGAAVTGYALAPDTEPNAYTLLGLAGHLETTLAEIRDAPRLAASLAAVRPEIVFHLAAQPLVRRGYRDPRLTFETNVMGTLNLLEAVRASPGVQLVLVVTSDKTYANREPRPQREDDALGGNDPYSASKACAEIVTDAYRASFFDRVRVGTARAGNVIGGGDWNEDRLIPDLVRAAANGAPARLRYPAATRPWQFVADVIDGYLAIVEALARDSAFARPWNLGPDPAAQVTVVELARRFAARYDPRLEIVLEEGGAQPESAYLALDATAARERLGWRPRYADIEAMIAATAQWYAAWRSGEDLAALTRAQLQAIGLATIP